MVRKPDDPLLWPFAATRLAMDACLWWMDRDSAPSASYDASALDWTTPNNVALNLATLCLRDFSRGAAGSPALICAPYALHRAQIVDFAPGHSLVEALQRGGVDRLFVTDWHTASPSMRFLSIDNYLADLNIVVDAIGPPVDLIGLCQGGWMALIYAARFPEKVRRLVLAGAPVDISIESDLSRTVAQTAPCAFQTLVASGGGLVRGADLLRFWRANPDVDTALQRPLADDDDDTEGLRGHFARWHTETFDLPGVFYLDVVEQIFRENRLAEGRFVALGRELHLEAVTTPVFLLAGADDNIVPPAQAMATAALLGTPPASILREVASCTHLGLFIGRDTLATAWQRVATWLAGAASAASSKVTSARGG